ncbi:MULTISPECIES: MgtC/SapB family protein [Streptomyces]|uniref:MgtC/SapB family protein n=1 Tax=Streptomyces yunnanensis TaxID=156453 RepID=A0ABY8A5A9_9ACTN|nr:MULTISPECIES: MgtC/SapB family protein [Streptomyces]AJC54623.1 MgtC/SapB transporter [Streptomyces sp. 769]UJB45014.1 MgtC/SapB family protein [Streptomyces sp. A1-5]WEB39389.1 MgtC/SapB family protein [Streptomyces yunnanensis]
MSHLAAALFDVRAGQGLRQFAELAIALLLSSLIGLEREARQKSAGLRTHTLVGVGSALFMEVSIHGFGSLLGTDGVALDPSRVAAQVVSGIGFIGGGLIFVRRDAVRGLTTAATIWLTCAIGMACGGGLPLLAIGATAVHFLIVRGFAKVSERIASGPAFDRVELRLAYQAQHGLLGRILELCTGSGFRVTDVQVETGQEDGHPAAEVLLRLEGNGSAHPLVEALTELEGVRGVALGRRTDSTE